MSRIITGMTMGALLVTSLPALADHRENRWQGHEIHRFQERDLGTWRAGHWVHRRHDGRLGWWWVTAGIWFFYPAPVYPYPDPYTPPLAVINQPPVVVAPQANIAPPPPAQNWYYCDSAKGYYPYVPSCPEAWRQVPAQPSRTPPN
jgi:hypothetical protein